MSIGDILLFLLVHDKIDKDCDLLEFGRRRLDGESILDLDLDFEFDINCDSFEILLGLWLS